MVSGRANNITSELAVTPDDVCGCHMSAGTVCSLQDAKAFMVPWNSGRACFEHPRTRSIFNPLTALGGWYFLALQLAHFALLYKVVAIPPWLALTASLASPLYYGLKGELSKGLQIAALAIIVSAVQIGALPLGTWTWLMLFPLSIALGCLRITQSSSWAASTLAEPIRDILWDELGAYIAMLMEWGTFVWKASSAARRSTDACLAFGELTHMIWVKSL